MMEKKSANGFQTKVSEGGVQRKQLPYSVETPYGFHLDLDFLKYVDDIEKGNTIKRVHIQRRVKGPPKFSTLPRNFSLPGHGVRPLPKEKDSVWSGTSTLGQKPKSRVTEVQQIFDFRTSEGGTSSQSSRGSTSPGSGYVSPKPRDEVSAAARGVDDKNVDVQSRPNLLRASSMPITLQQRKGSDSSSPDRTLGTPENGSTENMFRPSPDLPERRCVPQDRTGLHQQITVALKRVRELEEQVKTIPELKAQICSLREERVQLLLQLQAQAQISKSSSNVPASSEARTKTKVQGQRPSEGLNLPLVTQPTGDSDISGSAKPVTGNEKQDGTEKTVLPNERRGSSTQGGFGGLSVQEIQREKLASEKTDKQKVTHGSSEHQKLSQDIAGKEIVIIKPENHDDAAKEGTLEQSDIMQKLQEKLMLLEAKLTLASQELERTTSLLNEQIEENKVKEEKILQLSEGMRVEICTTELDTRPRRESIDAGTVTERIEITNQETETEITGTVDKGTDTEKICIEVFTPKSRSGSIDQGTVTSNVNTQDQMTEMEVEMPAESPPRPRANSMERGMITETIITQDQTTETPVAERVNQVTETEGEMVTDHPYRPRASSVDRGTETERVGTVDRVTETEAAQRTDQETETETERRHGNNPARHAEVGSQAAEILQSQSEDVAPAEGDSVKNREDIETVSESVVAEVCTDSLAAVVESIVVQNVVSDVSKNEESPSLVELTGQNKMTVSPAQDDSNTEEVLPQKSFEPEIVERKQQETKEKKGIGEEEIVCAAIKETVVTDTVVVTGETSAVKTLAPVRPQRGRKLSTEQVQPTPSQPLAAPVRPRRGSSETQAQQVQPPTQPQEKTQPEEKTPPQVTTQIQTTTQMQTTQPQATTLPQAPVESSPAAEPSAQKSEPQVEDQPPSVPQVEDVTQAKKTSEETRPKQPPTQPPTETHSTPTSTTEVQVRPKSIQAKSQTSAARRNSKEVKAPQRGSSVSHAPRRGSGEAQTRTTRQASNDQSQRRCSGEPQQPQKDASETQSLRRGSSEAGQRRGSSEAQASRRDGGEEKARRGSSESPTSPAALGQVVTRLTGLLGEQWAQLGSGSAPQQTAAQQQQESSSTQKQTTAKRAEAGKGTSAKPSGKAVPAAATAKPAGKPGPSKMSSIQSQLVSSLSVLSAFYSPAQKAAAANKQQEQVGLKSIMKKNGIADKQGNKRAKKNLKFVGVNGGYETTSSEESSGDEKSKVEVEVEKGDSPEPKMEEVEKKEKDEAAASQSKEEEEVLMEGGGAATKEEPERGLLDPESNQELLEEEAEGEKVDQGFIDACIYVKDRMEEVSSPDKEMRQVLVVLYKEWFKVSSQKESQVDLVRLYLRQVGRTTPTLLPYVINLTDGNGNMALHYSVSHSNFPVVKLLLDTGLCETDNVNKAGYTPVMLAALTPAESPDDLEVAQQLLRLGDVNARSRQAGQTALMLAVSHGRVAMVKLLLNCDVDVNAQDREGSTALMCASEHGHTHIARLLLETQRCDLRLTDKNGQTALSVAEGASHQEVVDLIKAHAESGAAESSSDIL